MLESLTTEDGVPMYDVCIIGAGPAGSTLARLIGRSHRVLLVDRRPLDQEAAPGHPTKLCGGLLAPRAQAELARQGLGLPGSVLAGPQLFAVRAADLAVGPARLYQRHYTNVDREAFDRWLVSKVDGGVEVATGWRATRCDQDQSGATVWFDTPSGGRASVRSRLVVGADGAASLVRRYATPRWRVPPRYVAIQARFRARSDEPFYGAVFDESLTDFYGWTVPKADSVLVGAAFRPGRDAARRFDAFVSRLDRLGWDLGREIDRAAAPLLRPAAPWHVSVGAGRFALVGEAAGFISPSSAEGISFALRSAALLGWAIEPGVDGALARYRQAAVPLAVEVCGRMGKSIGLYGSLTRRAALLSGLGSIRPQESMVPATLASRWS